MKSKTRTEIKAKLHKITQHDKERAQEKIKTTLAAHSKFKLCQNIGFYLAHKNELATAELITMALDDGKNCYLPKIRNDKTLNFVKYNKNSKLEKNKYGIQEPIITNNEDIIDASKLDIVIVPMIAVDEYNFRIGYGSGYYDRTFSYKKEQPKSKPYLIAIGYECQKVKEIISDIWDIKIDLAMTL